jgi:hypothetical protein
MRYMTQRNQTRGGIAMILGRTAVALLLAAAPVKLAAQQSSPLFGDNPFSNPRGGFQLYSITGFVGWQSVFNPQDGFILPNSQNVGGDESYGGSAGVGWSKRTKDASISIGYMASYLGQVHHSDLNALNHFLNLNATKRLGRKWTFGFSANSGLSTYTQMLFSPIQSGNIVAAAGPGDLPGAVLTGQSANDGLNSQLNGAGTISSPAQTLFFGNRVFVTSAAASLSYAHSSRLNFNFSANGSRSQHLDDGEVQDSFLVAKATQAGASTGVSYSLSPRTQIGVNVSASRGFSQIQDSMATNASGFIGRTLGRRWTVQLHAGAGFVTTLHSADNNHTNPGTTPVYGASMGYQTYAHTFMASADRSVSQSYGLATADTTNINGSWRWWRPGRSWGLTSSFLREQFRQSAYGNSSAWRAMAGVTRRMGGHTVVEMGYVYGTFTSNSLPTAYQSAQQGVRLSVMFSPQSQERH